MSAVGRVAAHEVRGYLRAPAAWGIATLFLAVQGIGFAGQLAVLSEPERPAKLGAVLEGFFAGNLLSWSLGLAVIALIAMRALAEDRRAGTWETLVTAPVGEAEAVIGKWLAGAAFHALLWAPTVLYLIVVAHYRPPGASWDPGPVIGAYLGVVVLGAALLAVAFAAAAASAEPLIAGGLAYAAVMLVFLVGELPALAPGLAADHPTIAAIIDAVAIRSRLAELARGEITTAAIALAAGVTTVGLSVAVTAVCGGRRRRLELGRRVLATALIAVVAIELGVAARRWPAAWDLTARHTNSLEPATVDAVHSIDAPIALTVIRPTLDSFEPVFAEAERVARRIAHVRSRIEVRVIDPATTAIDDVARDAGLDRNDVAKSGLIVVAVGDRRRVIDLVDLASFAPSPVPIPKAPPVVTRLSAEAEIAARLRELADPRPVVACFTTGHGELPIEPDPTQAELSGLATRIRGDGGRVESIETLAGGVPDTCSVVVVAGPTTPLSPDDALAIEGWVAAGGGTLVMAAIRPDGGELPPTGLEPVMHGYGIDLVDAVAIDPDLALDTPGALRVIASYGAHPITDGFAGRRATVWLVPRVLALHAPAVALVSTTAAGWGERRWQTPPAAYDPDDVKGPITFAAAAERQRGDAAPGRIVVIASAESISSVVPPGASAGEVLAARAVRWLAHHDPPPITTRDKTPEQIRLVMTAGERRAAIALCAAGVPLGFGGIGILVAIRRRRRAREAA